MVDSSKLCLNCSKRPAIQQPIVGYTYCQVCLDKQRKLPSLGETIELTTEPIREDRKKYSSDIVQPFRGGQLSREYAKKYPQQVKKMIKEGNTTVAEVKNSKNVWGENQYYKED